MTITAAAKIELFTYLVCQSHQPVLSPDQGEDMLSVVARSAASLFSGEFNPWKGPHPTGDKKY